MSWIRQRVDYNIEEFVRIVTLKGLNFEWSKATKCPCIQIGGSGQPDINCPLCMGKGWTWFDPRYIKALLQGVSKEIRYENPGELGQGMASIATLPVNTLGYYDRLSQLDSLLRHSELISKGDHNEKDRLRFQPAVEAKSTILANSILYCRDLKREYVEGEDFILLPNGYNIKWLPGGNEPNTGVTYTIEYVTHPRWIVIDMQPVRDTYVKSAGAAGTGNKNPNPVFTQLPVRATIRLEWFVFPWVINQVKLTYPITASTIT